MSRLPTRETWHKWWGKVAIVIVIVAVAFGISAFAWAVNNSYVTRQLADTAVHLSEQNLNSQNNHHAATVKTQAQLATALDELKKSAAAIEYEGGVIAFQNGEIIAAQQQGHATLAVMQALQQEVSQELPAATAALKTGQAEINDYLNFLSCLGTNQSNTAVCGTPPPLPVTQ